jgi:hypothetical protein
MAQNCEPRIAPGSVAVANIQDRHTTVGVVTVDEQVDSMKAAIKAYESSSKEEYSVRWDPKGTGTFDIKKALQDVEKSTEEYLKKGEGKEGLRAKVRGCLRKFGDNAESFTLLLEFLPSDTYGSLIFGGVSVILSAASKVGHAREGVLEALAEIPEILASAGIFDTMYKNSPRLQRAVSQLYVATLLALEYILLWFHQSAASMATSYLTQSVRPLTIRKGKCSSQKSTMRILPRELRMFGIVRKRFGKKLNFVNKR